MRTIAFSPVFEEQKADRMFSNPNAAIGDDLLAPYVAFAEYARKRGAIVRTIDMVPLDHVDEFVFCEAPDPQDKYFRYALERDKPRFLIIQENLHIHPRNKDREFHKSFTKVFTYLDDWLDDPRYVKLNYAFNLPMHIEGGIESREKLVGMIASSGKRLDCPGELYSERLRTIEWFERNHPESFDLFGIGWDRYHFNGTRIVRALNRIYPLCRMLAAPRPSYRGKVERKRDVLKSYKFAICYENASDLPGYISEKIFDSFFSGVIPIYWGHESVAKHIPDDCYIDRRSFATHEGLFAYLISQDDEDLELMRSNACRFLSSDTAYPFSIDCFVETLAKHLL